MVFHIISVFNFLSFPYKLFAIICKTEIVRKQASSCFDWLIGQLFSQLALLALSVCFGLLGANTTIKLSGN